MDPFNIVIEIDGEDIDLNLHPEASGSFKVLYHGGLVGEVFKKPGHPYWEAVSIEELDPGMHYMYEYDGSIDDVRIILEGNTIQKIGKAIEEYHIE